MILGLRIVLANPCWPRQCSGYSSRFTFKFQPKALQVKRSRDTTRAITVRLSADTASLLENIAADMHWSTSRLVGQLLEREALDLTKLKKNDDIGGLFAHLLRRHA